MFSFLKLHQKKKDVTKQADRMCKVKQARLVELEKMRKETATIAMSLSKMKGNHAT